MSDNLIIWLPDQAELPWAWTHGSQSGWAETLADRQALSQKEASAISIICPGQWIRIYAHELPEMRAKEKLQAAGYAIEDQLAAPLTDQHIVLGAGDDGRVGVLSRAKLKAALDMLDEAGITPSRFVADFDVIGGDEPRELLDREVHPGKFGYALDTQFSPDTPLPPGDSLNFSDALNFLQGEFQARRSFGFDMGGLKRIAALLAAAGLSWLVWQGSKIRAMNSQAEGLKSEMATLYTNTTGEAAPKNVASVVNRARAQGKNTQIGFMELSGALYSGLAPNDGVMVDTLRYDQAKNELVLRLIYPRFETASELEATFGNMGFVFQSGAVRERGQDLIGEAVLRAGGRS